MSLPASGRSIADVTAALSELKHDDVRWRDGRAFSLAYSGGPDVHDVADAASRLFGGDNALNTEAFPSLKQIQAEVVDVALGWLGADPSSGAAGFMTSGGTESILLTVKASRERGRRERGVQRPNVVLPASAHAAFEKAWMALRAEKLKAAGFDPVYQ